MIPPLPPAPPSPPQVLKSEAEQVGRQNLGDDPFSELGLTQEQFAEIALSGPLDWNWEQLDFLQTLLEGGPLEPEIARELVEDFITHEPKQTHAPRRSIREEGTPRELMDVEELAEELATGFQPTTYQSLAALDVPSSSINLDDWLKKK